MRRRHAVEIAHAGGHVYARCRCGWEGTPRPVPRFATLIDIDQGPAMQAAEHEARRHTSRGPLTRHAHPERSQ